MSGAGVEGKNSRYVGGMSLPALGNVISDLVLDQGSRYDGVCCRFPILVVVDNGQYR